MMNKVKEVEMITKELQHKETKLHELNNYQFKGLETQEDENNQLGEVDERKQEVAAYKIKYKQLVTFRDSVNKKQKLFNDAFNHEKDWNTKFREQVAQMKDEGIDVTEIQFSENSLLISSPLNRQKQAKSPKPLPIDIDLQRNAKPQPKQYGKELKKEIDEATLRRIDQNIKRQANTLDELQAQIKFTMQALTEVNNDLEETGRQT